MNPVEHYIFDQPSPQREIMDYLHQLIPGIQPRISYRIPFYYGRSWVCYLNANKKGEVDLGICRANELESDFGILEFGTRSQVALASFDTLENIPEEQVMECLEAALALDRSVKYASKRTKKG